MNFQQHTPSNTLRSLITSLCVLLSIITIASENLYAAATEATTIYFVRHAETLGNATHIHNSHNDQTLSQQGKKQVKALTRMLEKYHFDYILVSPKLRAIKTILPYLQLHERSAEIWPGLGECCWQKHGHQKVAKSLSKSKPLNLNPFIQTYFTFPYGKISYEQKNYSQGILQLSHVVANIKKRFSWSGKKVLIISHYHAGSRILEILQDIAPIGRYKLQNARISTLIESDPDLFQLIQLNAQ